MISRSWRFFGLGVVSAALVGSAVFVAAGELGKPGIYGPFTCGTSSCRLQTPTMDQGTAGFLGHYDEIHNGGTWYSPSRNKRVAGDKFVICNQTHCVEYTRTHSGGFVGSHAQPIVQPGGGDNGSGPPGLGGTSPGSGGSGGCTVCEPNLGDRWGNVGDVETVVEP